MKIKCINNKYHKVSLVFGKIYEVISYQKGWYAIIDETEEEYAFPETLFEVVQEDEIVNYDS